MNKIMNPSGSKVYNDKGVTEYTTPLGSHFTSAFFGYKHIISSGLEKEIMENLKGLKYE